VAVASGVGEVEVAGIADRVLRQVAGWLLPGAPEVEPVPATAAAEVVTRAASARMLGPLLAVVDAGGLDLPPAALDAAQAGHEEAMRWALHLETRLLHLRRWFDAAGGVPHLVVKGPAAAHLDELDPSLRAFGDLDLLVPATHLTRAVEVLVANGGSRSYDERRPGFDRRFVKSVTVGYADDVQVDVHRTLCDGTHGFRIPVDRLFDQATTFPLGGEAVPAPGLTHRALHAAYHGVVGSAAPQLRTVRDLAHHLVDPGLGPEVLAAEAERWRGTAVLAQAVRETFGTLQFDAPAWRSWLDTVTVDPAEAAIVATQRVESGSFGRAQLTALREAGWRDRAAYLAGVAFPTSAHLRSRGLGRGDLVRTTVHRAARALTR
jgi:hypothetical protein